MIPRDEDFDVFVSEGVLVEVWRGDRISVAQQFAIDWDGPIYSAVHAAVLCPPAAPVAMPASDPGPWPVRLWDAVRSLGFWCPICAALTGAVLALGMARGWW